MKLIAMLEKLFNRHLEDDEPLYLVLHRHRIFVCRVLTFPVLSLLATWVPLYLAPIRVVFLVILIADAGVIVWGVRNFLDEFLDAWLITDRAVIDVEWHGWFHRRSTRIDYASIEGVSYEIEGVLGTLLKFGTVTIEKIGSGATVSISGVPKPRDVESTILACQDACIRAKNLRDSSAVQDLIAEIVAERMFMKEK